MLQKIEMKKPKELGPNEYLTTIGWNISPLFREAASNDSYADNKKP
jgi:hypothetical protein